MVSFKTVVVVTEDVKKYEEAKMKKELAKLAVSEQVQPSPDGEEAQGVQPKQGKPAALNLEKVKGPAASDDEIETEVIGHLNQIY